MRWRIASFETARCAGLLRMRVLMVRSAAKRRVSNHAIRYSLFAIIWVLIAGAIIPAVAGEGTTPRRVPLAGTLGNDLSWRAYKARFVTEEGRVVDTGNGLISHSEGQGYGLVLAVAANDRDAFERIWGWTRANLLVRGDELLAWRWEPNARPAVADMNNATDGDLLVAWALAEAGEA